MKVSKCHKNLISYEIKERQLRFELLEAKQLLTTVTLTEVADQVGLDVSDIYLRSPSALCVGL